VEIAYVMGARSNFVKMAPVIAEPRRRLHDASHILVPAGRHYDRMMSDVFVDELAISPPDHLLDVRSGGHAVQTAAVMKRTEPRRAAKRVASVICCERAAPSSRARAAGTQSVA
jgi:UDP-N-acetylglucosamine 2-epimerase